MTEITKKQYILSSCELDVDMQESRIGKLFLYIDKRLKSSMLETADGRALCLLGNAFCTDKERTAEEDVKAFSGDDISEITQSWTGRWAVITEDELFTDATGLMSAFYDLEKGLVSSSLALIAHVTKRNIQRKVKRDGISWQILPDTLVDGVGLLLATQKLILKDGKIEVAFNNWIKDYRALSTEEKCAKTADILELALKNIYNFSGKSLLLALTGGKDSRVTFAALVKAGVKFSCYTAEHSAINTSDRKIPRKLAKRFNVEHSYVRKNEKSLDKLKDYYHFTAQNSDGADADFFACGQFDGFDEDVIIIRSGLYEAGQSYARGYTKSDIQGFADGITSFYTDLKKDERQREAFESWLVGVKENRIDYIDIRDRFYIEQRVGGWAAAIEHSFDMNDFTSIQIVNCAELLSILLSCNDEERNSLAIAMGAINILEPQALEYDINKRTFSDKVGIIIRGVKRRLKRR